MREQSAQEGFTLIEVLIVAILLGVFGALAVDTLTSIMKAQNKVKIMSTLEQSGNYALSRMEQEVRKADKITCCGVSSDPDIDPCPGAVNGVSVGVLVEGREIQYSLWPGVKSIRRWDAGDDSEVFLTDTNSIDLNISGTEIVCDNEGRRVTIRLELEPATAPARRDFEGSVDLETTVLLRGKAY